MRCLGGRTRSDHSVQLGLKILSIFLEVYTVLHWDDTLTGRSTGNMRWLYRICGSFRIR